tara:strand:+ start:2014 stop:2625 length:612 start_codon:yes stop_codon:yes gene_type:complete
MKDGITFKDNYYCVIKNTLSKEITSFLTEYYSNKAAVYKTMRHYNYVNKYNQDEGTFIDPQAIGCYSKYGDIPTDMILVKLKPLIEQNTGLKLNEQYSYLRVYKKESVLEKHKDRESCEISATLNIGCDKIWPIYLEVNNKQVEVNLGVGDLLVYKGSMLNHWREKFTGETCIQTFLHYNDVNTRSVKYDHRPHLGLPSWFKG